LWDLSVWINHCGELAESFPHPPGIFARFVPLPDVGRSDQDSDEDFVAVGYGQDGVDLEDDPIAHLNAVEMLAADWHDQRRIALALRMPSVKMKRLTGYQPVLCEVP
jgi:hypothetical protein